MPVAVRRRSRRPSNLGCLSTPAEEIEIATPSADAREDGLSVVHESTRPGAVANRPVQILVALHHTGSWSACIPGVSAVCAGTTAAQAVAAVKRAYSAEQLELLTRQLGDANLTQLERQRLEGDATHLRDVSRRVGEAGWSVIHETRDQRRRTLAAEAALADAAERCFRDDGWTVTREVRAR